MAQITSYCLQFYKFFFQNIFDAVSKENINDCYRLLISSSEKDVNVLMSFDVEGEDDVKMTSLHLSSFKGNIPITQLLLWVGIHCSDLHLSPSPFLLYTFFVYFEIRS